MGEAEGGEPVPEEAACGKAPKGMGPVLDRSVEGSSAGAISSEEIQQEGRNARVTARVGHPAPDFKAEGFHEGVFKTFQLSEYKGQWVLLCFYPGDFTFV